MQLTPEQVKGRIKNAAKENKADARTLMRIYMMERFLERVANSQYKDNFIIKGGMLVTAMVGVALRSTMDIDTSIKNQKQSRKSEKSGADSAERTIRTFSKAESFAKSAEKKWFVIGKGMVRCIFTVHLVMFPSQRKTSGTALTRSCTSGWKNTVICRICYGKALEKANSNQKK